MFKIIARASLIAVPFLFAACSGANSADDKKGAVAEATNHAGKSTPLDASDMILGDKAAPVTIVEYASVTCPHCAAFHEEIFPAIKAKYIDTGKVNMVFREFPTAPEFKSYLGSMLARCAGEKGGSEAYFLVIGALYDNQRTWVTGDTEAELKKIGAQAGIDSAGFEACMKRQDILDAMNKRIETAHNQYSVSATPTFFLEGEKLEGGLDVDGFSKKLDEAIAKAKS